MKKKVLSLALALVLCLGLTIPASAAGATVTEIVSADTYEEFYIDIYGYVCTTTHMSDFKDGIASIGGQFSGYGAVNTAGEVIIPSHRAWSEIKFQNGVAWIKGDGWSAFDTSGRELFNINLEDIGATSVYGFSDGLARVSSSKTGLSGYLDMTGKLVIPMEYKTDSDFHDGLARIYDPVNAFYGYMDKTGKVVIPYQYDGAEDFSNGYAKVRRGSDWSILDTTGKTVNLPEGYSPQNTTSVSPEILLTRGADGYVFINRSGKVISGPYWSWNYDKNADMYCVRTGGSHDRAGYVNKAGVEVIPCTVDTFGDFLDGFVVGRSGTYGSYTTSIFDKTGKVTKTWTGEDYINLTNIGNGCFKIADNKRCGFIDYTGREIVPYKYKTIGSFSCGVTPVRDFTGKTGFVNTAGEEVVPCKFTDIFYRGDGVYQVMGYHDDDYRWSLIRGTGWTAPDMSSVPAAPSTPSTPSAPAQTGSVSATPTAATVLVNGKNVSFDAYEIGGNNYFKLRDIGQAFDFGIGWDGASQTITIDTSTGYTA